jgi:predicted component of type VI protein secretion system
MNEEFKKVLANIIHKRMEIKGKLYIYSSLLKGNNIFEREINKLLDELDTLDKLEEEIRKKI